MGIYWHCESCRRKHPIEPYLFDDRSSFTCDCGMRMPWPCATAALREEIRPGSATPDTVLHEQTVKHMSALLGSLAETSGKSGHTPVEAEQQEVRRAKDQAALDHMVQEILQETHGHGSR